MRCVPQTRTALSADVKSARRRSRSRTSPIGHIQTIGAAESQRAPSQSPVKSLRNLASRDWKYSLTKTTRDQGVSQSTAALFNRVTETVELVIIGVQVSERTADRTGTSNPIHCTPQRQQSLSDRLILTRRYKPQSAPPTFNARCMSARRVPSAIRLRQKTTHGKY